jgi:5S rRNA maturation endonuclease (ribonuclease M5)
VATVSPEKLLAPYLAAETPRENGDIDAHCPLHNDRRRSAVINFEEGVWYCNTEDIGGTIEELIEQRESWVEAPNGEVSSRFKRKLSKPEDLPSEAMVEGWKVALAGDPIALDDLKAARGLWTKTADYYELGWDRSAMAYTIPVRNADGELVNVRRYQLRPPQDRRKIWGVSGHNSPVLYPLRSLPKAIQDGYVIICEGELDAIICNQYNFRAITRTGAARVWKAEWNKLFKDLTVYVCHDMDTAGQVANRKVARHLARVAKEVKVIRLPYSVTEKHGKDLTDWWLDHDADRGAFQRLLEEAQPFDEADGEDPEEVDPSPAAVMDAFDSRRAGRPLALTVTVKGKREPGYSVPRKVEFRCTRDMGKKCEICPMKSEEGGMDRVVAGADPAILEMIDSTKPQVGEVLRRMIGVPKCPKLNIRVSEHQAVEVLYARPSVEHANGGGQDEYKNIKLTSVGRHDTSPNQTVRVVGALHPDPRKQLNEFLTWDVSRLETSLDRFEMDGETYRKLLRFQPEEGQKPLNKLRHIADDLANHVTQIYGRPELHAAMDLVFHSAVSFDFDGQRMSRGWMELLVVGDTRTGKSEAATRLTRHYGAGEIVSCETASFAGVLGGLQQFGSNKEWAVTWGAIPINDRRLVVLDEISGLTPEQIGAMSSVRSSGVAELTKIQQERTYARTRLIWLGNPRNGRMTDYTYGVQAIKPLIGNPEDIARFDLAMSVASGDVSADDINRTRGGSTVYYPKDACRSLLRWTWSRTADHIKWEEGAEATVYKQANELGRRYVEDPPLIQAANVREKVARLAVAIAARLFSTDERGEDLIVKRSHVRAAVSFIDRLYQMEGFGYWERSSEIIADREAAERPINKAAARTALNRNPGLARFLKGAGKFRRQDLEEVLNTDREEANAIIAELLDLRMIYKDKGDVRLTPTLHKILRELK